MKILVAPSSDAAFRSDDFSYTVPGELLLPPVLLCDSERKRFGECSCGRSFEGAASLRATTVAIVGERHAGDVETAINGCYAAESWREHGIAVDEWFSTWIDWVDATLHFEPVGAEVRVRHEPDGEARLLVEGCCDV